MQGGSPGFLHLNRYHFRRGHITAIHLSAKKKSCQVGWSFGFAWLSRYREVDDVEPREYTGEDGPQDRTIPLPGTYDGDRRTESDPGLGYRLCCLIGHLGNHHRNFTERTEWEQGRGVLARPFREWNGGIMERWGS